MTQNKLIQFLTENFRQNHSSVNLHRRVLIWRSTVVLYTVGGLAVLADFTSVTIHTAAFAIMALSSLTCAEALATPGKKYAFSIFTFVSALIFFLGSYFLEGITYLDIPASSDIECSTSTLFAAIAPLIFSAWIIAGSGTSRIGSAAIGMGAASGFVGALIIDTACAGKGVFSHVFYFHFLPAVAVAALAGLVASWLWNWDRRVHALRNSLGK